MHVKKDFMMNSEDPKKRFKSLMKQSKEKIVVVEDPTYSDVYVKILKSFGKLRLKENAVVMVWM